MAEVKYNFLGNTGLKVSNICLGTMTFGHEERFLDGGIDGTLNLTEAESHKILDRFAELGGNFIDTANLYHYGMSEAIIGTWLEKQDRNKFVIATKLAFPMDPKNLNAGGLSRQHIMWSINESLRRLKTDYIDLYQTHFWHRGTPIEETMSALNDLVKAGKTRYIGVSNVCGYQLQKIVDVCKMKGLEPVVTLQQQYSLLCRSSELEEFNVCKEEKIGILPWSPLKGGLLTGKYYRGMKQENLDELKSRIAASTKNSAVVTAASPDFKTMTDNEKFFNILDHLKTIAKKYNKTVVQVSLRWLLQKPSVTSVIIGVRTLAQLEDNMGASAGWCLTDEEMETLDKASAYDPLFYWAEEI
ncbi:1-deoxyxylulose-5-phosphate synthase YajO-like isoform X2 [Tubulanus polymorphus]|uniref:1-deoxyxylulose-5-phosphate synthase YajO-like isoform X2 n=1 Tax=Tubulanus polymorphus TaxID=672921 RepID=UPI003DA28C76